MSRNIFVVLFLILVSCNDSELKSHRIKSGFIYEPGEYSIFLKDFKTRKIIVKQLKDESIIFAVTDNLNKILFQQDLNQTFSSHHYWCLYVDANANIWFYNSDYSSSKTIIFNKRTALYEMKDFCNEKLVLPEEFKKELSLKSTFQNCKSINK
jgi:hypothetical protein